MLNLLPNLLKGERRDDDAAEELSQAEENRRKAPKHGPSKVRYMSNGQVRRMQQRQAERNRRKGNRSYRRSWMQTAQRLANLRGQLRVLNDPNATPAMRQNVERAVLREYGVGGDTLEEATQSARDIFEAAMRERKTAVRA